MMLQPPREAPNPLNFRPKEDFYKPKNDNFYVAFGMEPPKYSVKDDDTNSVTIGYSVHIPGYMASRKRDDIETPVYDTAL